MVITYDGDSPKLLTSLVILSACLLGFGVVALFAGGLGLCRPPDEGASFWFQRSGSLTTLFGLLAELFLVRVQSNGIITGAIKIPDGAIPELVPLKRLRGPYNILLIAGYVIIAIGTIVWGYGDLIAKWVGI